jgi:leucyl-tRNA synthetase
MPDSANPFPPDDRYDPQAIEQKWSARWQSDPALYRAQAGSTRPKYYVLEMLPYPSGALHMGHVRNYAIGDALARYMWMRGYNVLHSMGWDSCGKRRHRQQHASPGVDAAQHRQHEGADEAPRLWL